MQLIMTSLAVDAPGKSGVNSSVLQGWELKGGTQCLQDCEEEKRGQCWDQLQVGRLIVKEQMPSGNGGRPAGAQGGPTVCSAQRGPILSSTEVSCGSRAPS